VTGAHQVAEKPSDLKSQVTRLKSESQKSAHILDLGKIDENARNQAAAG